MSALVWFIVAAALVAGYIAGRTRPRHRLFDLIGDAAHAVRVPSWLDWLLVSFFVAAFVLRPIEMFRNLQDYRRRHRDGA